MKEEKLDWFPIYWQRFIIGTLDMSAEEIGAYILLLIHQWDKGFIPENPQEIKKISRVSVKKLENVLKKFDEMPLSQITEEHLAGCIFFLPSESFKDEFFKIYLQPDKEEQQDYAYICDE